MKKFSYIIFVIIIGSTKNPLVIIGTVLAYFIYLNQKHPEEIQKIKNFVKLKRKYIITVGVIFAVFSIVMLISPPNLLISLPFFLPALVFSILQIRTFKKARLYEDIPTSKMRSVAMGLVEVKGEVEVGDQLNEEPIFNKPCVYYSIQIEKRGRKNRYRSLYSEIKS